MRCASEASAQARIYGKHWDIFGVSSFTHALPVPMLGQVSDFRFLKGGGLLKVVLSSRPNAHFYKKWCSRRGQTHIFTILGALAFKSGAPVEAKCSLSHFGGHLGVSWPILGLSWAILGHLGPSWGHLGPSWGFLGLSWGKLGVNLGSSWGILGDLGAILGLSWGYLGPP